MNLVDTNIVSTFARVGALPLIQRLLQVDRLYVCPAVFAELRVAVDVGVTHLEPVVRAIEGSSGIELLALSRDELLFASQLPVTLAKGEAESIAVCVHRQARLLTNDKRAAKECLTRGVQCLTLHNILRALWTRGVLTKKATRQLLAEIEQERGMVIKNKEQIFK